jgi:drug/metabolite transporter (DMT)-like permease
VFALLAATLIWSFSFGIIKQALAGVPGDWLAFLRLALAGLVFLPFAWRARLTLRTRRLMLIGGVQFGVMYLLYLQSYPILAAWEIALFTVFTPVWVLLLDSLMTRGRSGRIGGREWLAVIACVIGAWLVRADPSERPDFGQGFLLVQGANLCFAFGQVAYRRGLQFDPGRADAAAHAWMFLGGTLVAGLAAATRLIGPFWSAPDDVLAELRLDGQQIAALAYLGIVASGFGFYLWNAGARRVSAGLLATMNNLKVPSAVVVSVVLFGEEFAPSGETGLWLRKIAGAALVLAAVLFMTRSRRPTA